MKRLFVLFLLLLLLQPVALAAEDALVESVNRTEPMSGEQTLNGTLLFELNGEQITAEYALLLAAPYDFSVAISSGDECYSASMKDYVLTLSEGWPFPAATYSLPAILAREGLTCEAVSAYLTDDLPGDLRLLATSLGETFLTEIASVQTIQLPDGGTRYHINASLPEIEQSLLMWVLRMPYNLQLRDLLDNLAIARVFPVRWLTYKQSGDVDPHGFGYTCIAALARARRSIMETLAQYKQALPSASAVALTGDLDLSPDGFERLNLDVRVLGVNAANLRADRKEAVFGILTQDSTLGLNLEILRATYDQPEKNLVLRIANPNDDACQTATLSVNWTYADKGLAKLDLKLLTLGKYNANPDVTLHYEPGSTAAFVLDSYGRAVLNANAVWDDAQCRFTLANESSSTDGSVQYTLADETLSLSGRLNYESYRIDTSGQLDFNQRFTWRRSGDHPVFKSQTSGNLTLNGQPYVFFLNSDTWISR